MYAKSKKISLPLLLSIVAVLLLALGFGLWYGLVVRNIASAVTVEAGMQPCAEDFLIRKWDFDIELITELTDELLRTPGEHPVELSYRGRSRSSVLRVQDTVPPTGTVTDLTVLAVDPPEAEDFLLSVEDETAVSVSFGVRPNLTTRGQQHITVLLTDLGGNVTPLDANLTLLFDEEPPVLEGVEDLTVYVGVERDFLQGVSASDNLDTELEIIVDATAAKLDTAGVYPLRYYVSDDSGNLTELTVELTVILDEQAPAIYGVNPLSIYEGSSVSYRSNIIVQDDYDPAPLLTIDSSEVNLSVPGTYPVIYRATDAAGNEAVTETTITVKEKRSGYVEEAVIYAKADEIIASIITEDMDTRAQVEAIYRWLKTNHRYSGQSDKNDRLQSAYALATTRAGDCFSFDSLSCLLFDRLGIPYISVRRAPTKIINGKHFWSLVSLDGGKTYYHFDSTPQFFANASLCLVTDDFLDSLDYLCPGYFYRDRSLYPATPLE